MVSHRALYIVHMDYSVCNNIHINISNRKVVVIVNDKHAKELVREIKLIRKELEKQNKLLLERK